jgi:hypothetical protein
LLPGCGSLGDVKANKRPWPRAPVRGFCFGGAVAQSVGLLDTAFSVENARPVVHRDVALRGVNLILVMEP